MIGCLVKTIHVNKKKKKKKKKLLLLLAMDPD